MFIIKDYTGWDFRTCKAFCQDKKSCRNKEMIILQADDKARVH